jgi:lipoyl(octanoyl) transferase
MGQVSADSVLQAYLLGAVPFETALSLQRLLVYEASGARESAALLLCEHPPLITVGRHGSRAHILFEPEELGLRRWPVRWVNRGGGCLLHLPGQLAVYPILALDYFGLGIQGYLDRLQEVVVALLDDFSIHGETRPGRPGVRVRGRLIASVGVAVRDWVAYYGLAFNINPDLVPFRQVRCDGPSPEPMTSLERERHGPLRTSMVRERFIEHFAAQFQFGRTSLFHEHPVLGRKTPSGAVAAV